jgi:UDP-glucose 4-epimerase
MRTVVVTGAHGFLGRHVARRFARAGWEVTGIGHGYWSQNELAAYGISFWHTSDISLEALVTYACEPEILVHCAGSGSVPFSIAHPYEDYSRTVATTAAVLDYIRLHSVGTKLIYPSSAAVYGKARKLPIAEADPLKPASPYGVHKAMAEMLCRSYASNFGLVVGIARLFSIYGEGLKKQLLWDACNKAAHGDATFFGSGAELRDWLHADDAADLLYTIAEKTERDCVTINGGNGEGVPVSDILKAIFEYSNSQLHPQFSGQPRAGDPPGYQADMTLATQLGWKSRVSWRDGVRRYVQWFSERSE